MLHVGMILGERYVTCRHDSGGKSWEILGKDMLHVGVILGERAVTCRHDSGKRYVTCRRDSGGKSCYM